MLQIIEDEAWRQVISLSGSQKGCCELSFTVFDHTQETLALAWTPTQLARTTGWVQVQGTWVR